VSSPPREVYVLGAGFTRAFAEDAPLLLGDYDTDEVKKFDAFPHTHAILEQERTRSPKKGMMDLERLMTRLAGGMPYDWKSGQTDLLRGLLSALRRSLLDKLSRAKVNVRWDDLKALARHCLKNHIDCITFNYDDLLDQALWEMASQRRYLEPESFWHPDWGYGFFSSSSVPAIGASKAIHGRPLVSMSLLKLHGSVNWRVKHGYPSPYATDAITHFEDWWTIPEYENNLEKHRLLAPVVEPYLDPEPFIVPPVLTKGALVEQPVLRVIWSRAFELLKGVNKVTFVGYSLPVTDIAAGTLFCESLTPRLKPTQVKVVDYAADPDKAEKRRQVLESYGKVFPGIADAQIDLRGGLAWAQEVCRV